MVVILLGFCRLLGVRIVRLAGRMLRRRCWCLVWCLRVLVGWAVLNRVRAVIG